MRIERDILDDGNDVWHCRVHTCVIAVGNDSYLNVINEKVWMLLLLKYGEAVYELTEFEIAG